MAWRRGSGGACSANQVWYSLTQRGVEFDLLPWQRARQMPLMAYSPVDQGTLLSHAGLREMASRRGVAPAQLALAWVLAQGESIIPIPGTKHVAYVEENADAADLEVSDEDLRRAGSLINAETVSGDRYAPAQRISLDPD